MFKKSIQFTLLDFLLLLLLWLFTLVRCVPAPAGPSNSQELLDVYEEDYETFSDTDVKEDTYSIWEDPCVDCAWYFCPPLDSIWQKQICINNCSSPPTISYEGECEEYFECDPSVFAQGSQDCTTENGFPGTQEIYCNKGHYAYGNCQTECSEEICDYVDNDCDDDIDEGQQNQCGACGILPYETCDSVDNDCDDGIDEDLIQECFTPCGKGIEYCVAGNWISCTAPPVEAETCNNMDDDCDDAIDEDLDCGCTQDMLGVLLPCAEEPLICGQGFKSCECVDPGCTTFAMSPCQAACVYYPSLDPQCDPFLGVELEQEACNKFDDDCDQAIDESLSGACYTGPDGTVNIGICAPGEVICIDGVWGNYLEDEFQAGFCAGEVLPEETDNCNGTDEDCDGVTDDGKELQDTDVLFIVDWSGSMVDEIGAVEQALSMFAANYSDEEVIQWGMIIGPVTKYGGIETLEFLTNLTNFQSFISALANNVPNLSGGREMLLDALYLSIYNISTSAEPADKSSLLWENKVASSPDINNFNVAWRKDSKKVIIIFTDEKDQTYLIPKILLENITSTYQGAKDLKIYIFTNQSAKHNSSTSDGWGAIALSCGGEWFELTQDPSTMYSHLTNILDENICE